jgi:3-deoxy-7-phosphoheptulonate synthase
MEGAQPLDPGRTPPARLTFGQSVTDACLGWEDSVALVQRLALAVKRRRSA